MSRVELQPAFVLHRRPFRNTSLIVDLLTAEHGRVALVARGARSGKKNASSSLQPFQHLLVSWRGSGEMYLMTGVEEVATPNGADRLGGNSLFCAYYVNELALKLLPRDDPHPEIFAAYNKTLVGLSEPDVDVEPALRGFEISLLEALGYQLVLDHDVESNESIDPKIMYSYVLDRGPVKGGRVSNSGALSVSGETLTALTRGDYSLDTTIKESRRLLRALIDRQLDGRPLKSRELYLELRNRNSTTPTSVS